MPREDEGSGAKHAHEQQVVAADAGEDDLETASGTSATGTDVERDEYVEAIYEDAINEANKGRSLVHDALNSCSEPIFMILVGLQLLEVSRELSEVETEDENFKIEGAYVIGTYLIVSGAIFSFMCLYAWLVSSMKPGLQALKGRSETPVFQAISMLLAFFAIFSLSEVETKIIEDPSNLFFLALGTFTDVVDYWAGVKATLKAHKHGAYTFPLTQVSPLLYIVLEFIAAPVTLVVGLFIIIPCGLFFLIVFCCCLFPILYITKVVNRVQRAFVEDFLSVARLPVNIIKWGGNLGSEGPSSRKLNAKTGVENLPEDAVNQSRVLNAYGIYVDVLLWVVLLTDWSLESVLGLN